MTNDDNDDDDDDEQARINHEIDMTLDHTYRFYFLKAQEQRDIEEHGIDED